MRHSGIILYLQVFIQSLVTELVLQMDPEVHVFHRVNYNVDELHAGHLVDTQQVQVTMIFALLQTRIYETI